MSEDGGESDVDKQDGTRSCGRRMSEVGGESDGDKQDRTRSCGIEPHSPHQRRPSVFFLDFWFLCCVWILVRRLQLDPRLLKCAGVAYMPLTSGCRSSPSDCGRAPSRHRQRRRWPCSRCRPRRCTAGGPGRSGRRPWRTGQQRSGRKGSGTSAAQRSRRHDKSRDAQEWHCTGRRPRTKRAIHRTLVGMSR
jgi:hypothetical protein